MVTRGPLSELQFNAKSLQTGRHDDDYDGVGRRDSWRKIRRLSSSEGSEMLRMPK